MTLLYTNRRQARLTVVGGMTFAQFIALAPLSGAWLRCQNQWLVSLLLSCPSAGSGVHRWLFKVACELRRQGCPEKLMAAILAAAVANCGREVPAREIEEAVRNSRAAAAHNLSLSGRGQRDSQLPAVATPPKWPAPDYAKILKLTLASGGVAELVAKSPFTFDDQFNYAERIIDDQFPENPLLCLGKALNKAVTREREFFRREEWSYQFIVPSPMIAPRGRTKAGRMSNRSLNNVGPRTYLVIECDFTETNSAGADTAAAPLIGAARAAGKSIADICAAVLMELANLAPLALVVHSGGKSLHGWFRCAGTNEDELRRFMNRAVLLGADRATFCPCQFVRMPDGKRDNGKRQQAIYWNPQPTSAK